MVVNKSNFNIKKFSKKENNQPTQQRKTCAYLWVVLVAWLQHHDYENICLSCCYHHHIGYMIDSPLCRVRLWNNGKRCMSCYGLIEPIHSNRFRSNFNLFFNRIELKPHALSILQQKRNCGYDMKLPWLLFLSNLICNVCTHNRVLTLHSNIDVTQ